MPASVRDNVLVSYEVLCEERKIVLHTESREHKPPEETTVVFLGVEAYHFKDDTLGSILLEVENVPVADLLARHRAEILESSRLTAWPWAKDLDAAPQRLADQGVSGFVLSSSHGMTGWILAKTSAIASSSAVDSSEGPGRRGVYALAEDGSRSWLDASGVAIAFGDGRKLVVSLSSHPASRGGVALRSEYDGPGGGPLHRDPSGALPEVFSAIALFPGGGNVLHASVRATRRGTGETVAGGRGEEAAPGDKSYFLIRGEEEVRSPATSFLFDCGEGRVLQVDRPRQGRSSGGVSFHSGPPPSKEDFERWKAGGPFVTSGLAVRFGGSNVVFVEVSPPHAAQPFTPLSPKPKAP